MSKKKKTAIIVVSVILALALAAAIIFPSIVLSERAKYPEYSGTERDSVGIVPTKEQVANAITYDRVVIFGVDGGGAYFNNGVTPNFERVFQDGSVTFEAISEYPTSSGGNWASMLTGVKAQTHKINNTISAIWPNVKTPTIFKILHEVDEDATFFSACDWGNINYGMIENFCNVTKVNGIGFSDETVDEDVKERVLKRVAKHDDKVTFIQFDNVDHIGEIYGYGSAEYEKSVQTVDSHIGEIYDAYVEKGIADSTLFICICDHGHKYEGGHGGESDTEKFVTFAVAGGKGNIIKGTPGKCVVQDMASVVLYALGVEQPESFESCVPYNMFNTLG